jgi:NADPH2:quinone reductase
MSLPETMTAIEITEPGGPEVLKPTTRPVPTPGPDDVLIRVAAAGVNRPDAIQRAGHYPPPPGATDLPGLEVAGTVVACGDSVTGISVGGDVCALTPGGGYAEYCVTPAAHCLPFPRGYDMIQAAGVAETCFTVWHNVFERGALKRGELFLVHGGSSGIGTMAIQLAREFGARVLTTAGTAEKCRFCESLGAERAINYREEDWPKVVRDVAGRNGVDVILDMVGGPYIQPNINALGLDGRLVMIGFLGGAKAEVDFTRIMVRRQTVTGSTLRAQSDGAKAAIAVVLREKVWPLLDSGAVRPIIHGTFDFREADKAHALMETSTHTGKIILTITGN